MNIEEDIKILEDYSYAMASISSATEKDIRVSKAMENIIADREFYKEWYGFYKDEQSKINKKIKEILNLDECIETLEALNRIEELLEKEKV